MPRRMLPRQSPTRSVSEGSSRSDDSAPREEVFPAGRSLVRRFDMKWRKSKSRLLGFIVLLPSFLLLAIFVYYFIGRTVYWSLTDWGRDPAQALAAHPVLQFIGLSNYRELFTGIIDSRFRQDIVSTIFFTLFFITGCLVLGLLLAILLDHKPKGESVYRTVFLFPFSLSFVVTGTIW